MSNLTKVQAKIILNIINNKELCLTTTIKPISIKEVELGILEFGVLNFLNIIGLSKKTKADGFCSICQNILLILGCVDFDEDSLNNNMLVDSIELKNNINLLNFSKTYRINKLIDELSTPPMIFIPLEDCDVINI